MRFVLLIRTKLHTLNFDLTVLDLDFPFKFSDTCIISQSAMMCKFFPHARFQSSLETFDNTGFGFWIFSSDEINRLSFKEILKFFTFKFSSFICLQTFWTSSTFNTDLKANTKVFSVLSLIVTTHAYFQNTSMINLWLSLDFDNYDVCKICLLLSINSSHYRFASQKTSYG